MNVRIGTWNLDNRKLTGRRLELLRQQHCDVWLLTEVPPDTQLLRFHVHVSHSVMTCGQHWAAVLSREPLTPLLPDPHAACAAAEVGGVMFVSMVLPWATCRACPPCPWTKHTIAEMMQESIDALTLNFRERPLVWGGDWNQNLTGGNEAVGSGPAQELLTKTIQNLNLQVPTADLLWREHMDERDRYRHSIDHIAVPAEWRVHLAVHVDAVGLSDHDAYIVEVQTS